MRIATSTTSIREGGVDFSIRLVTGPARKSLDQALRWGDPVAGQEAKNPFLPYDETLFVSDLSDSHLCLLNKFVVFDRHLLLVTRRFESQESLLTRRDFAALWTCLGELDWLAFYNGGKKAGASQSHRHLQLVDMRDSDTAPRASIEAVLKAVEPAGAWATAPQLPFVHCMVGFAPVRAARSSEMPEMSFRLYRSLLEDVGLNRADEPEDGVQLGPYNLLMTRDWMLVVPRSEECFASISVNALGFAGAFLARNEEQLETLVKHGPLAALEKVGIKRRSDGSADNLR